MTQKQSRGPTKLSLPCYQSPAASAGRAPAEEEAKSCRTACAPRGPDFGQPRSHCPFAPYNKPFSRNSKMKITSVAEHRLGRPGRVQRQKHQEIREHCKTQNVFVRDKNEHSLIYKYIPQMPSKVQVETNMRREIQYDYGLPESERQCVTRLWLQPQL